MFTKLYSRITESSLMEQPIEVRYTFIMLLAIADPTGRVVGTDVAIARRLNMPLDSFVNSVKQLGEPDPDSNSKEEEGRRVIPSDSERGYQLVNYIKYRNLKDEEEKREYMREYMRKRREDEALRKTCKTVLTDVKNVTQAEAEAEAEAEANSKKNKKRFKEPSIEEVKVRCAEIGLPDSEAERFWNYHAAKGWVVGNQPMRSWVAALNTWKLNGQKFNQGARGPFKAKSTPTRADGEFCPGWQDKDQKDMTDREIVALAGGL